MRQFTRQHALRLHLHADFNRSAPDPIDRDFEPQQIADVHRRNERQRINHDCDDGAMRVTSGDDAAALGHQFHNDAAGHLDRVARGDELLLLLLARLAADRQDALVELDVDVLGLDTREASLDCVFVLRLVDVERRGKRRTLAALAGLAAHMGVTPSTMSITVERLVRGGYVSRIRDRDDTRRVQLRLTESGVRIKSEKSVLDPERVQEMLANLTREERRRALAGLALLARASQQAMHAKAERKKGDDR